MTWKDSVRDIIVGVLTHEKTEAMIKRILGGVIAERVMPVVPVALAAALDAAIKQIPGVENLRDATAVANQTRDFLNDLIPDIDLPIIGDLTDFWRPR